MYPSGGVVNFNIVSIHTGGGSDCKINSQGILLSNLHNYTKASHHLAHSFSIDVAKVLETTL